MDTYEKKLKEALNDNTTDYEVVRWIEQKFPELKESEDEKVRKALIHYMKDYSDGTGLIHAAYGVSRNDAIAWLEKQGEQKPDTDFSNLRTWKYIVDAVLTEKEGIGQYLDSPFTEEVAKKLQKRFGNIGQKLFDYENANIQQKDFATKSAMEAIKELKGE